MAKYAGKNTQVTIGANTFGVKSWKAKHQQDGADTTDTASNGQRAYTGTLEHVEWSVEFEYDPTTNPVTNAPNIKGGSTAAVRLYLKAASVSEYIDMPVSFIESVDYDGPVDGIVKGTVTGKSNGSFTLPS